MTFILINVCSLTYVANNPPAVPLPYRKPAVVATVPISQNGSTEQLGYIDNGQICVHWFIHVTDIHLSANANDPKDITYGQFLNFTYNQVHPFTLVVTGDLDSGIQPSSYVDVTPQTLTELGNYFALANSSPYATDPNPYRYLEVAGNHERNNDWGSQVYLNYTLTGRRFGTVQTFFTANFSHGEVAYAMVDSAAPMEAVPVPFGSEGNLDPTDFSEYSTFLSATRTAELKFTFQHQSPLDTFGMGLDPATGYLRDEQGLDTEYGVNAVFFGHMHANFVETWGDQVYIMGDRFWNNHTDPTTGLRTEYYYHLVAVDSGGVNYVNVPFSTLPHILITNPTNPLFLKSTDCSTDGTRGDGYVRALVIANASDPVVSVDCQVDGGQWLPMALYPNCTILYESARGTPTIPADNAPHTVQVRVRTQSGAEYYQTGAVSYQPKRIWFWQGIIWGIVGALAAVILVVNRDNFPLRRPDGSRRRLSHAEKVAKRMEFNQQRNKPWWLPILGGSVALSFFFIPWGIFPMVHGAPAAVYTFWVITPIEPIFLIESLLYSLGLLILIFPFLYFGIRRYHPEMVNFAAILIFANTVFMAMVAYRGFALAAFLLPGVYLNLALGIGMFLGNWKNTRGYRFLQKLSKH